MTAAVPAHDRFERPSMLWYLLLDSGIASLALLSVSAPAYEAVAARVPVPPRPLMKAVLIGTAFVHVGEATLAYRTAKRAGMDRTAGRWARETFVVGFPSILRLKKIAAEGR
jgi:hypothetical protein